MVLYKKLIFYRLYGKNKILGIRRAGSSETFRSPKTATGIWNFRMWCTYHRENASVFVYRSFQEIGKGDDRRWDDRQGTGRSGGCSDESLGCRKGSNPLHPLVSSPERSYGRKTRWVYWFAKKRKYDRSLRRPDAGTARARCIEFSERRYPEYFWSQRIYRLGSGISCFHQQQHLVYTDGIRGLYGRSPGL